MVVNTTRYQYFQISKLGTKLLPPANEVCEGYVFTGVCLSTGGGGGMCGCWGGIHGCQGACVVAGGVMCGCWGACVVAGGHAWLRGVCGCGGVCVVGGGHAWLPGGMHGCQHA